MSTSSTASLNWNPWRHTSGGRPLIFSVRLIYVLKKQEAPSLVPPSLT